MTLDVENVPETYIGPQAGEALEVPGEGNNAAAHSKKGSTRSGVEKGVLGRIEGLETKQKPPTDAQGSKGIGKVRTVQDMSTFLRRHFQSMKRSENVHALNDCGCPGTLVSVSNYEIVLTNMRVKRVQNV
jgi:hypothetical protein